MLTLTTQTLPEGCVMKDAFQMILVNRAVEVSSKGLIRGFLERERNELQEAFDFFVKQAPREANAIIGIQVSTASQQFGNGAFLYLTIVGTPIIYEQR